MDGIYSGILRPRKGSRPIDVSHISQERMQKRQIEEAKAAEERKRNQDTMKDVLKSLYVEPQFKNSRLNRVAREKAAEAVSNIVSLHATGDPSSWVGAMNELAKYNQVMSELRPIDDNWVNAAKVTGDAVKSGKGSFLYSPTTIEETGKTYSNLIELYNDPINDRNDKATQEGIETYGIAPFVSQVETSAGTFPVFQVPEAAIYADYAPEVMKAVTGAADELYSERIGKPYTETLGRASTSYQEMGLPTPVKEGLAAQTFSNREHVQFAVKAAADDYVASHPEMTRAQAMSEHMSRISSDPNYLKEVIKTYGIDRGVMPIVNQAKKRVQLESYTTPSSGGSPAKNAAETHFGGSTFNRKGDELVKALPATDQVERWFLLPEGSTFFTGTGEGDRSQRGTVKTKDGVRLKVSPQEVVWNTKDLSKSRIVLLSNMDENMRESSKRTYTYEVPLDMQTFGRLAEMFKTTKEDAMGILLRDADAGAVGDIKKWAESLGMDASQIPGPGTGQSSTPASGSSNTDKYAKYGATKR